MSSIVREVQLLRTANDQLFQENELLHSHLNHSIEEVNLLTTEVRNLNSQNQVLQSQHEYSMCTVRECYINTIYIHIFIFPR